MKKIKLLVGVLFVAILAAGCTNVSEDAKVDTFILNKDNSITDVSVEDYSDSSFKIDDLESFVKDSVVDYNEKNGDDSIVVKSYTEDKKVVKLVMEYATIKDYNNFNNTTYTVEKVSKADLDGKVKDMDGKKVSVDDVEDTYRVLTINASTDVYVKNSKYYSTNLKMSEDKVFTNADEEVGYIIFK